MAITAKTTVFELNISSNLKEEEQEQEQEEEKEQKEEQQQQQEEAGATEDINVPNTGMFTGFGGGLGNNGIFIFLAIFILIASLSSFIICRIKTKKNTSFKLKNKKLNLVQYFSVLTFLLSLGLIGKIAILDQYSTFAENKSIDLNLTTTEKITLNINKDTNNDVNCKSVAVKINKKELDGYAIKNYKLYMNATDLKDTNGNKIGTITGNVLENNTWGYKINNNYLTIPSNSSEIISESWNGESDKDLTVQFCVQLSSSAIDGTYTSEISFGAVAEGEEIVTPEPDPEPEIVYMQNFSCSSLSSGETTTLYDSRDREAYLVGKLADGNCWLLDNLRLDLTDSTVQANLSSSTTNASDTTLSYLKNGGGTTSDKYATAGVSNWTSSYSFSAPLINTSYKDTTTTSYGSGSGKIGVYYNYCAASAGSYCYGDGTSSGTSSGNAAEDICPKGWRLPTGGSSGEYQALYTAYSSNVSSFQAALSTPLSGYFYNGSASNQGSYGYFWSSTRNNDINMYSLYVYSTNVDPTNNNRRCYGSSVRCLASS